MQRPGDVVSAIVSVDYDYICLIDVQSGLYDIFTGRADELIPQPHNDYDDEVRRNVQVFPVERDRELVLREMKLDHVREKLEHAEKFSFTFAMANENGPKYKLDTFFYLDETRQEIVLIRKDVTEVMRRQQDDTNRLRNALVELEQASEAKTEFLSNMSHDLRTPLNGILGFTEIGLQEDSAEGKQRCLEKIGLSGSFLLDLVNDTLELSRVDSGKSELNLEVIDDEQVLRPILVAVRQSAETKGVNLVAPTETFPCGRIRADRLKLQKIVLNLLSNAVKFTPERGTVRYAVEAIDPPAGGMTRRITVEDTGIGMSPEFLEHLYEPFSQERRPEVRGIEGTGLGLSITKRMVDLMKGTISVESHVGRGTRFVIELPIECLAQERGPLAEEKPFDARGLSGRRVLLCEDNPMNTEVATILLQKAGVQVEHAADGQEALQGFAASERGHFDAILMDIRMPVMDGFLATRKIRSLDRPDAATIPIVAMSADAFEESVKAADEVGMNGYLTKPIDSQRMYETLLRHIGSQSAC